MFSIRQRLRVLSPSRSSGSIRAHGGAGALPQDLLSQLHARMLAVQPSDPRLILVCFLNYSFILLFGQLF